MDGGFIDGLNMLPRPGEPESALLPGMAAPASQSLAEGLLFPSGTSMPDSSQPQPVALQTPGTWVYDFDPANGSARATFNGEVSFTSGGSATAGVTTFNTRSGAVTLTTADITAAGGAPASNPTLAGVPNAPTAAPGTNTTQIATTMFVQAALGAQTLVSSFNGRSGAITLSTSDVTSAGGAPAANAALTGTPTAPTAIAGTTTGQLATTQFVANAIAGGTVVSWNGRTGAVTLSLSDISTAGGAPLASPNFTGVATGVTATAGTASTQLATTAFVTNAILASTGGVASFNTRTGAVTLQAADVSGVGGALLAGPAFTGAPTAPTPGGGDSSTKIATTAFVSNAIASQAGVLSFNSRTGAVSLQAADVTDVGGALLASPSFTGTPIAPTAAPGTNTTQLATTAFVVAGDAAKVAKSGDAMSGALTIAAANALQVVPPASTDAVIILNKPASGQGDNIVGQMAGLNRWSVNLGNNVAESGSNAGSDFAVNRYNDAGTVIDSPLTINRATGLATFSGSVSGVNATFSGNGSVTGAMTAGSYTAPSIFNATSANAILNATGGSGVISLRPQGFGSTAGQMTVDAGGSVIITGNLTLSGSGSVKGNGGYTCKAGAGGGYGTQLFNLYYNAGPTQLWIDNSNQGNITVSCDYRIKRNVEALPLQWETVKKLRPVKFNYADYELWQADDVEHWGFIAHELQETLIDDAATGHKDEENLIQSPNMLTIVAALTSALQEAMSRIEALEAAT
jgi:hypothetical protein